MASIELRGKSYRVVFRFDGERYSRALQTRSEKVALGALHRLEDNLRRTELGTLTVPESVDPAEFLLSDGKAKEAAKVERSKVRTLGKLCEAYLESMPDGAIEANTRNCIDIHIRHFHRDLGRQLSLLEIDQVKLQEYVNKRAKAKGRRGMPLRPDTIKKELATLTAIWNWALRAKHVSAPLEKYGLRFPKSPQKPPFQTFAEVTRKCKLLGLSQADREQLWDSVFLTVDDIEDLLAHVRKQDGHPFIYPMFAFAAHTGARRSEMMRSRLQDIDLVGKRAVIREKKRVRGQETTRTVPLSPFIVEVLTEWFEVQLGARSYAQLIPKWRFAGYRVVLLFLWLPSADLAIARVATRVKQGGHNIPESTIRRRFDRGLANLRKLYLPLVDETHIYEASVLPPIFVWKAENGKETVADGKKWTIIDTSLEHLL